jgi:hypothetical protein
MGRLLIAALLVFAPSALHAAERCYTSEVDQITTITDDGTDNGPLVWKRSDGRTTVMSTMSAGTGLQFRVAIEENGASHNYRYIGDMLLFDMNAYTLGCPGGHSWVDAQCSRVLISQVDAYAETALLYYLEPGEPLTDCVLPTPFKTGETVDVECSSGKKLHIDAGDYPALLVDDVEMVLHDGDLPCTRPNPGVPFSARSLHD